MKKQMYARLLIQVGIHIKKGQTLVLRAPVEAYEFVRIVCEEAYQAGAGQVVVRYQDESISHMSYLNADASCFESIPSYESDFFNQTSEEGAAYLTLIGSDPNLMKDVDPHRMSARSKAFRLATKPYRNRLDFMECAWCIAAVATPGWAKNVYTDCSLEESMRKLWDDIFTVNYIDQPDPISYWMERKTMFEARVRTLNALHLKSLQYTNALGTNLVIELPEEYQFAGGGSFLKDGTYYYPNVPTEEVFTAPKKTGVHGKVVASLPLNHGGTLIEDFWFQFQDGKVIDFGASKGKRALGEILSADEGSAYIGEVALVPYDSSISQMHRLFYETLIDENASCHLALGQSYPECIKGGLEMNETVLLEHGMNQSTVHVDFMIGTSDLKIIGKTIGNEEISIFENGSFTAQFSRTEFDLSMDN